MFYLPGDFNLLIRTDVLEVLVAEYDDFPLCCKQRKFIQAILGKLRQLNSADLCADKRAQIACYGIGGK